MEENYKKGKSEIFSKAVRAGKRTYFFDVKATKDDNLYITVTESKRRFKSEGGFFYEKHKLFLYKEDLIKFSDGLMEVVEYVRQNNPTPVVEQTYQPHEYGDDNTTANNNDLKSSESSDFTEVDFDDLG